MGSEAYHIPVLLHASVDGLNIDPNGTYVDVTFGGGGHSVEILKRLDKGRLFAFDQDPDAASNIPDDERFTLIQENFRHLSRFLRFHGVKEVDGVLADLGISSHQIDEPSRGFSLRFESELDMRMDQMAKKSAATILAMYPQEELARVLYQYGEVKRSRAIAAAIVRERVENRIQSSTELINVLKPFTPGHKPHKFLAQVFQALRIEVNDEMGALKEMLEQCTKVIKPGGRLSVISYHSLEDRLVKNYLRSGSFDGEIEKDFFGKMLRPFKPLRSKPILPTEEEINENNRARSAKLRIATRQT